MPKYILPWISMFSTYIPLLAAFILVRRQHLTKDIKILLLFLGIAGTMEAIALGYGMMGRPNLWMLHVYTPIEFSLTLLILSYWHRDHRVRRSIRAGIPVYLALYALTKIYQLEDFSPGALNYLTRPVSQLIAGGVAVYTLQQIWYFSEGQLHKNYRFWITAAFLLYNAVGVIIFALTVVKDHQSLFFLAYLHALVNIAHNLLFTAGILCAVRFKPELAE